MSSKKKNVGRRDILSALGIAAGALTLGGGARLVSKGQRAAGGPAGAPVPGTPVGAAPAATAGQPAPVAAAPAAPVPVVEAKGPAPKVTQKPNPTAATNADVQAFFGPIRPGTRLGAFTVRSVHGVHLGGIAVVLEGAKGERFQVDVLAKSDGVRKGVANTRELSLYLANAGNGRRPSVETHGQAAMALGRALARREQAGAPAPRLLTLLERGVRHPGGVYDGTYLA